MALTPWRTCALVAMQFRGQTDVTASSSFSRIARGLPQKQLSVLIARFTSEVQKPTQCYGSLEDYNQVLQGTRYVFHTCFDEKGVRNKVRFESGVYQWILECLEKLTLLERFVFRKTLARLASR